MLLKNSLAQLSRGLGGSSFWRALRQCATLKQFAVWPAIFDKGNGWGADRRLLPIQACHHLIVTQSAAAVVRQLK